MAKAKKVTYSCGSLDENYEAQMDKGDGAWDFKLKKGDVYVNAIGEITSLNRNAKLMDKVIQEHEVVGALYKTLVERVFKLQELTTDRFHVMGSTSGKKMHILLTTEFAMDITKKYFWRRVRSFAHRNGGAINQMTRSLEDGGVIEKHVEVIWHIEDMTYDDVKALIDRARKDSGDIWSEGGMSVR
jgi:hypothetical protein